MKLKALNHFKAVDALNEFEVWLREDIVYFDRFNPGPDADMLRAELRTVMAALRKSRKKYNI